MDWVRFYIDILDDPKMAKLSDSSYRIFTYLLLLIQESGQNGSVTLSENEIAWRLRLPLSHIKKAIFDLKEQKIISNDNNCLQFLNWNKRQYKSDDVSVRVKRYREKSETLHVTAPEQSRADTEQSRAENVTNGLFNFPTKEEISESSKPNLLTSIENLSQYLYEEKIFPEIFAFKSLCFKNKANLRAMAHTLTRCAAAKPNVPWAYCVSIMKKEDGKFNARDYQKDQG